MKTATSKPVARNVDVTAAAAAEVCPTIWFVSRHFKVVEGEGGRGHFVHFLSSPSPSAPFWRRSDAARTPARRRRPPVPLAPFSWTRWPLVAVALVCCDSRDAVPSISFLPRTPRRQRLSKPIDATPSTNYFRSGFVLVVSTFLFVENNGVPVTTKWNNRNEIIWVVQSIKTRLNPLNRSKNENIFWRSAEMKPKKK